MAAYLRDYDTFVNANGIVADSPRIAVEKSPLLPHLHQVTRDAILHYLTSVLMRSKTVAQIEVRTRTLERTPNLTGNRRRQLEMKSRATPRGTNSP
jgi:hypothetical protein